VTVSGVVPAGAGTVSH